MMYKATAFLALLLAVLFAAGCSSQTQDYNPATGGKVQFTFQWPAPTKLLPANTNSIRVDISSGSGVVASKVVDRPASGGTTTVLFESLPVGNLVATATAFPQTGAQGVPVATGSVSFTTIAGQTVTAPTINMTSTITRVEVTPANSSIQIGQSTTLTATARDAAGNVVLVAPNSLTWSSDNTGIAIVDATGKVTGVGTGTTRITVTEFASGIVGSTNVTVGANP